MSSQQLLAHGDDLLVPLLTHGVVLLVPPLRIQIYGRWQRVADNVVAAGGALLATCLVPLDPVLGHPSSAAWALVCPCLICSWLYER